MTTTIGTLIDLWVPGVPVPQGNLSASRKGRLYHTNAKELHEWRYDINWRARAAMKQAKAVVAEELPMALSLFFVLYRPKATAKTRVTPPAIRKPDLDKLARACGDALTSVVYVDDSQIIESHCYKRLAEIDEEVGVRIVCQHASEWSRNVEGF
jgi:crossover junction endodeoxyribonuclease RusA